MLAVLLAGMAAGAINTIVGSGSLITFPTLLAVGLPPVTANVTNTVGLIAGSVSGAVGYRRELQGQRSRVIRLSIAAGLGGLTGGLLLLNFRGAFLQVVPWLVLFAVVLVAVQPRLSRFMAARRARRPAGTVHPEHPLPLTIGMYLTGIYGGYFGAAQGVIMIALLGVFLEDDIQRLNAVKNVAAAVDNGVAAILFLFFASIQWDAAILLALGSLVGGQIGAYVGRRLAPTVLRLVIIVVGTIVAVRLLLA
jgi:uncharacterized membrane protein YfcA